MLIKKIFYLLILTLSLLQANEKEDDNEVNPSLYLGLGNGSNLGGSVGIGTEIIFYNHLALNLALGSYFFDSMDIPFKEKLGYDIGLKLYPNKYFYFGFNYGIVEANYDGEKVRRTDALSIILGGKTSPINNIYLSSFIGTTSSGRANRIIGGGFFPRFGIVVGYYL